MTTVYGVTRFGARLQIAKQLKDIDDFPKDAVWSASSYLTGMSTITLIRTRDPTSENDNDIVIKILLIYSPYFRVIEVYVHVN